MQMANKLPELEPEMDSPIESARILADLGLESKIITRHLDFYYGETQVLFDNNLYIAQNQVTAIIGPSGCGKSTHIRVYNREIGRASCRERV